MQSVLKRLLSKVTSNDFCYLKFGPEVKYQERLIFTTFLCQSKKEQNDNIILPPEPQDCCMSGCANCVWIKYAEEVAKLFDNDGEIVKAKIQEHVKDPNLRSFLLVELDHVIKNKKKN